MSDDINPVRRAILNAKCVAHDNPAEVLSAAYWGFDDMSHSRVRFLLNDAEKAAEATLTAIREARRAFDSAPVPQAAE